MRNGFAALDAFKPITQSPASDWTRRNRKSTTSMIVFGLSVLKLHDQDRIPLSCIGRSPRRDAADGDLNFVEAVSEQGQV